MTLNDGFDEFERSHKMSSSSKSKKAIDNFKKLIKSVEDFNLAETKKIFSETKKSLISLNKYFSISALSDFVVILYNILYIIGKYIYLLIYLLKNAEELIIPLDVTIVLDKIRKSQNSQLYFKIHLKSKSGHLYKESMLAEENKIDDILNDVNINNEKIIIEPFKSGPSYRSWKVNFNDTNDTPLYYQTSELNSYRDYIYSRLAPLINDNNLKYIHVLRVVKK